MGVANWHDSWYDALTRLAGALVDLLLLAARCHAAFIYLFPGEGHQLVSVRRAGKDDDLVFSENTTIRSQDFVCVIDKGRADPDLDCQNKR